MKGIRTKNGPSLFVYINEGITQYIANKIMRKRSDAYPFEVKIIEQLVALGNEKDLIKGYFETDYNLLIKYLQNLDNNFQVAKFINKTFYGFKYLYSYIYNDFYMADFSKREFYKHCESHDEDVFYSIQKDLLNIYNNTDNKIDNFSELMLDATIAQSNINPPETPLDKVLDINLCGFSRIDELKARLGRK